jgi:cell division protein FtsI/penicillin-binding protein 2
MPQVVGGNNDLEVDLLAFNICSTDGARDVPALHRVRRRVAAHAHAVLAIGVHGLRATHSQALLAAAAIIQEGNRLPPNIHVR